MTAPSIQLNKRVKFQSKTLAQDANGEMVPTWANVFATTDGKIWGAVNPLSGRELIAAQAAQSELSTKVTVRYQSALSDPLTVAKMRIVFGTRTLNISAVINRNESGRLIDLLCSEGVNLG